MNYPKATSEKYFAVNYEIVSEVNLQTGEKPDHIVAGLFNLIA